VRVRVRVRVGARVRGRAADRGAPGALQYCPATLPCNTAWRLATGLRGRITPFHMAHHHNQALAERLQQTRERRGAAQARSAEVRLLPPLLPPLLLALALAPP